MEAERRMDLASEVASLKSEIGFIHRENNIRHDNFMREKVLQDKIINDLAADVKSLLALANQSKGGFWVGMGIASSLGAFASWVLSHLPMIFKG